MNQTTTLALRDEVLQSMMAYSRTLRQLGMDEQAEMMDSKIMEFLDSPEKERTAFEIYLPQVARYYTSAKNMIDDLTRKNAMSLNQLMQEQQRLEVELRKLQKLIAEIQYSYDYAMREIMMNIASGYDGFARSVENNWISHFSSAAIPFGLKETAKLAWLKTKYAVGDLFDRTRGNGGNHDSDAMAEDPEFKKITAPIIGEIEKYLRSEGVKMEQNIMASSQSTIKYLESNLQHDKDFIATELVEVLIDNVVSFVIGSVGWHYQFAHTVWGIERNANNADSMGQKIVLQSKGEVVKAIKDRRDSELFKMQQKFNGTIRKDSETVFKGFQASLRQQQDKLAELIRNKQKNEAENARELKRLAGLKEDLLVTFNKLAKLIQNEQYDEAGVVAYGIQK